MEKTKIIEALYNCGHRAECSDCPYVNEEDCRSKLADDAAAMLKASTTTNAPEYPQIFVFTKRTNLTEFFCGKMELYKSMSEKTLDYLQKVYATERDVELICMFRLERNWKNGTANTKYFCKIKCPISPLPVKGEFEAPSPKAIIRFLENNGWTFKQRIHSNLLK